MVRIVDDGDSSTCWQCGAPADPTCVQNRPLESPLKHPPGNPSRFHWRTHRDTVRVAIPRCAACRDRNWVLGFVTLGMALVGALAATSAWPTSQWAMIGGGFAGLIAGLVASNAYQKRRGFRSSEDYPPLRRLRAEGWSAPN